jgi:hypothetical protein
MKTKTLNIFCFLVPYVITVFNLQVFVTRFISNSLAQLIAYGNIALLFIGIIITLKKRGEFSKTARLWIIYYITYFAFATLGSALNDNPAQILVSIIPFIYILAFYFYLSIPENRKLFREVTLVSFTVSSILCIYFFKINFDLDFNGIYMYKLDRAEGVFGDANNAALVAILSYIFIFKLYNPIKRPLKYFKIILLLTMFYCLFLTFSTTGFLVFIISNIMLNHKFFSPKRILLVVFIVPVFYLALINLDTLTKGANLRPHQQMKIDNIVNILTLNTSEVDDSGRNELVANLINYIYENPFIGNGIDFAISQHGHNTIVGVWADAGIFTLLIFIIMLLLYLKNSIIAPPNVRFFALPLLISMCVFMLSLQSVINQPYLMALFVYIGYIIDEKALV